MEWIAAAIVFVFLLWRFPRWTLIGIASVGVIGASAFWIGIVSDKRSSERYRTELARYTSTVSYGDPSCRPEYPLMVKLFNGNDFTVNSMYVRVVAKAPGRSSSLYDQLISSDFIMGPSKGSAGCWSLDTYKLQDGKISGYDPKELVWTSSISSVSKAD